MISAVGSRFFEWIGFNGLKSRQLSKSDSALTNRQAVAPVNAESIVFPLSAAVTGDRLQIVSLDSDAASSRLRGMGLIPGVVLNVMSAVSSGPMVVALNHGRLGLGPDMTKRIQVMPLNESATAAVTTLQTLEIGSTARVAGYAATSGPYRRKLLAMGFTKGTEFTLTRRAPLGDPVEVKIRGFRLSLRKHEADALLVTPVLKAVNQDLQQPLRQPVRQPLSQAPGQALGQGSTHG